MSDGPFDHPAGEVSETRYVDPAALDDFIATHPVCRAAVDVMVPLLRP